MFAKFSNQCRLIRSYWTFRFFFVFYFCQHNFMSWTNIIVIIFIIMSTKTKCSWFEVENFVIFFVQQRDFFVVVFYQSRLKSKLKKIYRSKLNGWHFDWRDFLIIIEQTLYSTCWWNEFKLNIKLIRIELKTKFFDKIVDFSNDDFVSFYFFVEIIYSVIVFSNRSN